jgi:hypothetical protein
MPGKKLHISSTINEYFIILDTCDCFTCSFKEFLPFNSGMYYYSSCKVFKAITPA